MKIFKTIECVCVGKKEKPYCVFSAICDDDGFFTVRAEGNFGKEGLENLVKELDKLANE